MYGIDRKQETLHSLLLHYIFYRSFWLKVHCQIRLCYRVFVFYFRNEYIKVYAYSFFVLHRHGTQCMCFTWNGIVQVSAFDIRQTHTVFLHSLHQEAVKQLVSISSVLADIVARMSSGKTLYRHTEEEPSLRSFFFRERIDSCSVSTSGTADEEFAIVFWVEVKKDIAIHESFFQGERSGKSGFFVYCKQAFYRTVLDIIRSQYSQLCSYTDTVIGTQCSTLGTQPFAVNVSLDWVSFEIVLCILVLFAHHIYMRLQYHCFQVFHASRSRFLYQHVSCFVGFRFEIMLLGEIEQVSSDLFFFLWGTRHLAYFIKIMKHYRRS